MISALVWVPRGASQNKENEIEDFISSSCIIEENEAVMEESDESSDSSSVSVGDVLAPDLNSLTQQDTLQADYEKDQQDEEEREDLQYRETDAVVICGLTEDEVSSLVFYVIEDTEDGPHLYPHHDLVLPSFPLSLAWCDISGLDGWNCQSCVAVGSLIPQIEIYDASAVDELEPLAILGETRVSKLSSSSTRKKTKRRPKKVDSEYHVDSVLSLSWNRNDKRLLASGSADCTVRCWDITTCKSVRTWLHHEKEVQSVCWHEKEPTLLLSGSFDQTVSLLDIRVNQNIPSFRLSVDSDVESVCWVPTSWEGAASSKFLVTLENGTMELFDSRMASSESQRSVALWTCKAHEKAVSACTFSTHFKGMLVTGSLDESLRLWDCKESRPQLVQEWKTTGVGAIFATQFCQDIETSNWLALSGSKGKLELLDILTIGDTLVQHFPECSQKSSRSTRSFIGVYSDDESLSSSSSSD
ncbi:Uncharacterized WD repeat-containing protein [Galdieria sulphuraria]|uniref:Transducin family protein / WD-40 repeat family protein n=1 Tax=Galdieria sulphuraria TaxID=130081 RepID=M2XTA5_GALSU|nr:transducin family protein / WD-40 repeat family protein [Galdieria sulphuraria]EME26868.1 transducin family protein / WD-40 repeat family protein [Galdieria sulphuraria]GJD12574.1 Uncharacterized WD repeat-containing protein [Galdieria sulphuraria]|eukprot:XP_005703388.1 transducin family protein / WD-40 repeat family protein [Galdieria sulphuraria]